MILTFLDEESPLNPVTLDKLLVLANILWEGLAPPSLCKNVQNQHKLHKFMVYDITYDDTHYYRLCLLVVSLQKKLELSMHM